MIEVTVTARRLEADDIYSYELARTDGQPLPAYAAGAHIDVEVAPGLLRQYSLCPSADEHRYVIGVLKDPASRGGSVALHERVQEGTALKISEPRLLFPLAHNAKRSVLFAGGIGVTPILSMAERLQRSDGDFALHYCARSPNRMAFRQQILSSSFAARTTLHFDDGEPAQQLDAQQAIGAPDPDVHLYVCGPAGFMQHIISTAKALGWAEANIHREYFAPPESSADTVDANFEVMIASTGLVLQVPAGKACVEVLNEANLGIPVSCEQGVCGTCIVRVLEGTPDHRDLFLTDAEHEQNDQFTPCCSRSLGGRLVLDL